MGVCSCQPLTDDKGVYLAVESEGYANAGLKYLQEKWDNERFEFQEPFVFVSIIDELNASSVSTP